MKALSLSIGLCGLTALSGCSITPPETPDSEMCGFTRYQLEVDLPDSVAGPESVRIGDEQSFMEELRSIIRDPRNDTRSMLFLSGGSQDGAFGAGYLHRWAQLREGGLPSFKVVTGVSTGAIHSTFAFVNQPDIVAKEYRIEEKDEVLNTFVPNGNIGISTAIAVARNGAIADLSPLRKLLLEHINGDVLAGVAEADKAGRRLYVGVVDVDTGKAIALDMTAMATKYVEAFDDDARSRYQNCYVEAIVASSSVPMAALPVFIDNRMYIDGGARFGVFSDNIGEIIEDQKVQLEAAGIEGVPAQDFFYYVIVNGDLTVEERCGKADSVKYCTVETNGGLSSRTSFICNR